MSLVLQRCWDSAIILRSASEWRHAQRLKKVYVTSHLSFYWIQQRKISNLYLKHAVPFTFGTTDTISVLAVKAVVLTIYQGTETNQSEGVEISSVGYCELVWRKKTKLYNSYITIFNL